jgi:hypothetical protein
MTAHSTKDTKICVLKLSAIANAITPTAITKASPPVVTLAAVTGMAAGDLIKFPDSTAVGASGFPELDGKSWIIGSVDSTAKTFTLIGADTTTSTGTLAAGVSLSHYTAANFLCICKKSDIEIPAAEKNTVATPTFCDPSATVMSQTSDPGTVTIDGYVDVNSAEYKELYLASQDGQARDWRITIGGAQGYLVFNGPMSGLGWNIPIDGATEYSGNVVLTSAARHLF